MPQDDNYWFYRTEFDRHNRASVITWAKWLQGRTLWESYNLLSSDQKKAISAPLRELSENISTELIEGSYKGDKGIAGQLLEMVHYGLRRNNRKGGDIPECGLELKSTGIKYTVRSRNWVAKERLTLGQLNYEELIKCSADMGSGWEPKGLTNTVIHVYFYKPGPPFAYKRGQPITIESMLRLHFAGSFAWGADESMMEMAYYDWRLIKAMCESGYAHMVSERYSQFLGCAPRGLGSKTPGKESADYSAQTVEEAQGAYKFAETCKCLGISQSDTEDIFRDISERQKRPRDKKYGYSLPPEGHHNLRLHGKYPKQRRAFTIPPSGLTRLITENLKLPEGPLT